jgi:hypothetical protein
MKKKTSPTLVICIRASEPCTVRMGLNLHNFNIRVSSYGHGQTKAHNVKTRTELDSNPRPHGWRFGTPALCCGTMRLTAIKQRSCKLSLTMTSGSQSVSKVRRHHSL